MDKILWCLGQKAGIEIVEQNSNLAEAYTRKAEESLISMRINTVKDWKISTAYYTMYFSLYAVLMKIGIKCEIHSCSIACAKRFLSDYFTRDEINFLNASLKARIDAQYYVDREVADEQLQRMVKEAPQFLVKCKSVLLKLDEKKINEIRKQVLNELKKVPKKTR